MGLPEGETPELQRLAVAMEPEQPVEPAHLEFEDAAKEGYTAYVIDVGGTTWDGRPVPAWDDIKERQRNGWRAAVKAAKSVKKNTVDSKPE